MGLTPHEPFADRVDILGSGYRIRGVTEQLLDHRPDPVLQEIAAEAASVAGTPIALVTILLDNIQLFRARVGVSDEDDQVAANARDTSWCQFVVRDDAVVEVQDGAQRPELPQIPVRQGGIRAYMGAPIHLEDRAIGSLCVVDTRPRAFDPALQDRLSALAQRVDARIAEWGRRAAATRARRGAAAFAGLRSRARAFAHARDELRVAHAEVLAEQRMRASGQADFGPYLAARSLRSTAAQLAVALDTLDRASGRFEGDIAALEASLETASVEPDRVGALVDDGCRFVAEAVGGIRWHIEPTTVEIARPGHAVALVVAAAIGVVAGEAPRRYVGGLDVRLAQRPGAIVVELTGPPVPGEALAEAWAVIEQGPIETAGIEVEAERGLLRLRLPVTASDGA